MDRRSILSMRGRKPRWQCRCRLRTASITWWATGLASAPATVRAYAYDVANLARFLEEQRIPLTAVGPMDIFAWVDWQGARRPALSGTVVRLAPRSAAPATVNRRVAAVR